MKSGHGFLPDVIVPEDYVFGAIRAAPEDVLQEHGQWDDYLPVFEFQYRNQLETSNCVTYGTLNCIEILLAKKYGEKIDHSERYVGVLAGTSPEGNTPNKVSETIRKTSGLILESELPFDDSVKTWNEYYSPKPMESKYLFLGGDWLKKYRFKHEWVFTGGSVEEKRKKLLQALRHSPLGVSVYAWSDNDGVYYKPQGSQDNHWTVLYGYEQGRFWKVFDSYDATLKKLAWDYDFGFAKRFYIEKIETQPTSSLKDRFWKFLVRLFGFSKSMKLKILDENESGDREYFTTIPTWEIKI